MTQTIPPEKKPVVLVVEDEDMLRQMLAEELEYCGCDVLQAAHGAQALPIILDRCPDIVLCDVTMPFMDGLDLLNKTRAADIAQPGFYLLTAAASKDLSSKSAQHKPDGIISKPVDVDKLIKLIGLG